MNKKLWIKIGVSASLLFLCLPLTPLDAASKGQKCSKVGTQTGTKQSRLVCTKVGKKLVWRAKMIKPKNSSATTTTTTVKKTKTKPWVDIWSIPFEMNCTEKQRKPTKILSEAVWCWAGGSLASIVAVGVYDNDGVKHTAGEGVSVVNCGKYVPGGKSTYEYWIRYTGGYEKRLYGETTGSASMAAFWKGQWFPYLIIWNLAYTEVNSECTFQVEDQYIPGQ